MTDKQKDTARAQEYLQAIEFMLAHISDPWTKQHVRCSMLGYFMCEQIIEAFERHAITNTSATNLDWTGEIYEWAKAITSIYEDQSWKQ